MSQDPDQRGVTAVQAQWVVLLVALSLFAIKILAWWLTHSVLLLGDALESVANIIAGFVGLYALYLAAKPRDQDHPYGHGKVEFLSAGIEGALVAAAGLLLAVEALGQILAPQTVDRVGVGMFLIAFTALINGLLSRWIIAQSQRLNSPALRASGQHLMTDVYSSIGVILAVALVALSGWPRLDGVLSLGFAIYILYIAFGILREAVAGVMDEADDQLLDEVIDVLEQSREDHWVDVHNLRIIRYGSVLHVDCHLTLPFYYSVVQAHDAVDELEALIEGRYGDNTEMFIHVDACKPALCPLCQVKDCQARSQPFETRVVWSAGNVRRNAQHMSGPPATPD